MKVLTYVEPDGQLTIHSDVLREMGFAAGEAVELLKRGPALVVVPKRNLTSVFDYWAGYDRHRAPMSVDEIVAEQREMRGHDDLD